VAFLSLLEEESVSAGKGKTLLLGGSLGSYYEVKRFFLWGHSKKNFSFLRECLTEGDLKR